jgi:RecA/RadA recombinase
VNQMYLPFSKGKHFIALTIILPESWTRGVVEQLSPTTGEYYIYDVQEYIQLHDCLFAKYLNH